MSININVINQRMSVSSARECYVEGSQQFVEFRFNLGEEWEGLKVFAQFAQAGQAYNQYLNEENCAFLPSEIKAGECTLMLYGSLDSVVATTNYLTLKINRSLLVEDASSTEISESLYNQLITEVQALSTKVSNMGGGSFGGVGIFANEEQNSEIFNDYEENAITGEYNHVEGKRNTCNGTSCHIEGQACICESGDQQHIEGCNNKFLGESGSQNHIEGSSNTCTGGYQIHIQGQSNTFVGTGSANNIGGQGNSLKSTCASSTIIGRGNTLSDEGASTNNDCVLISGQSNKVYGGSSSVVSGYNNTLTSMTDSHVFGSANQTKNCSRVLVSGYGNKTSLNESDTSDTIISGSSNTIDYARQSIITGVNNTIKYAYDGTIVSGDNCTVNNATSSIISGTQCTATSCYDSFVGGNNSSVETGSFNFAFGSRAKASNGGFAIGGSSEATGAQSFAAGFGTQALYFIQNSFGNYNDPGDSYTNNLFTVGNGHNPGFRNNALNLSYKGELSVAETYLCDGQSYAEYYEWEDGNPDQEDRQGLFVTLNEDKLVFATSSSDYILGVVIKKPTIIGNAAEARKNMQYQKDAFGNFTNAVVSGYDWTAAYTPRSRQQEFSAVGMVGQIVVIDDGTCEVNGYCSPDDEGKATKSDSGFRVIKRIDETHVKIVLK